MSGFVAVFHCDGSPVSPVLMRNLTSIMAFRGPDGQHVLTQASAGLGIAALYTSENDRQTPLPWSFGPLSIVGDIRLDRPSALASELAKQGCAVAGDASSAKLVLHAYATWGEACVERFAGDFSFAIWDENRRTMFCARDQLGVRPAFYFWNERVFVFSNTLQCVRAHPHVSGVMNDSAVADFLLFGSLESFTDTIYADIHRLPPANCISVTDRIHLRWYWSAAPRAASAPRSSRVYVEEFKDLLQKSVCDRLRTHRAGVLMSGGLDSTSVAAMAMRALESEGGVFDLRAHTGGYRRIFDDPEPIWAERAARQLGIPIEHVWGDEFPLFERPAGFMPPEPSLDVVPLMQETLLRAISKYARVGLTGEGGDLLYVPLTLVNEFSWRHLPGALAFILRYRRVPKIGFRTVLGRPAHTLPPFPEWIAPEFDRHLGLQDRWRQYWQPEDLRRRPRFQQVLGYLNKPFWPNIVFEAFDPGFTGVPVQVRHPLLDVELVTWALALPDSPKLLLDKGILREAMKGMLPEDVRRRPKTPLQGNIAANKLVQRHWSPRCDATPMDPLYHYVVPGTPVDPARSRKPGEGGAIAVCALHLWLSTSSNLQTFAV